MEIRPFRGWRYGAADVGALIAPPYDILSLADKEVLLDGQEHNIVGVDLPHCPPSDAGPEEAYAAAAARLRQWMETGVLRRDQRPSLYAYEQGFSRAGRACRRRSIIAAVRLAEFGQGVWPHEKTFPGPKADRLKLTAAAAVQLSPILGFYEDDGSTAERLFSAAGGQPTQSGVLRGVEERLWCICDEQVIGLVCGALRDRALFIADGHHRYTTALDYRRGLGDLAADHPANFVMFALVSLADEGLTVLPTHRVITGLDGFDLEGFVNSTRRVIEYQQVRFSARQAADADGFLKPFGPHAMVFAARSAGGAGVAARVGILKDPGLMRKVAWQESDAWRRLDVSILHRLVIDHFLMDCRTARTSVEYFSDGQAAYAAAAAGRADLVVFLQATPLEAVRDIALSGAVMPHKSTYFYPKCATGMVLYPLE